MNIKRILADNVTWLYRYFDKNKGLMEIFSILIVAQSFMYSSDLHGIGSQSLGAFKVVFWIMMFLIIVLLQVSTAIELQKDGENIIGTIFTGANLMKIIMRLLTLTLLLASVPIFIKQLEISIHNRLFSIFYVSLGLIVILELLAFTVATALPKVLDKTGHMLRIPRNR